MSDLGRMRKRAGRRRRRGAALLMTICVLGVLVLMVGAFAAVTRIERAASANYVDGERARFLAWSGVERAKFELRRAPSTPLFPLQWAAYEPTNGATTLPPLEQARDPSFRVRLDPLPAAFDSTDPSVLPPWPSGIVGASYYVDTTNPAFGGDYYVLKVEDTNGKIALNDGNPHLRKMLDTLARFRGLTATDVGQRVLAGMPRDGYRSVEDLRRVLDEQEFAEIAPFVAVHSFIDRRVIEMGEQYAGGDTGTGTLTYRAGTRARQPRAPVNINTAPLPVLVAVFNGIGHGGTMGNPTEKVDYAAAQTLAQAVKAKREQLLQASGAGFQKWSELYQFLLTEGGLTKTLAAAVLANCNPNTDTNKLVPDLSMYRPVDKLDLTAATTELTFAPGGIYEIESLGVILAPDSGTHVARVVAASKVRSVVRVFERMVDRMQDDFEADRIDKGPTAPATANLRDMTTLPEYRNDGDGPLDLAADWDGQVTFNVITSQEVSLEGAFAGFLAGDLNARPTAGGGAVNNIGSARGEVNQSVAASPDMSYGSDLHPFGARTGAGDRSLAFAQDEVIATVHREVPESEIIMTDGHGNYASTLATIPGWTYDAIDAHAFELWFKPDHPVDTGTTTTASSRQVLLEWESGGPRAPGSPDPVVPGGTVDMSSFVSDVHDENVQNYLDAVAAGGPGPAGVPPVHVAGDGVTVPPPPPEYFFGDPLGTGPLPWNQNPYPPDRDPAADAELYASMLDQWFADKFGELVGDMFRNVDQNTSDGITWGAKARLTIWLERAGSDDVSPMFRVRAHFEVAKKDEEYDSTSNAYSRDWVSTTTVRAGTWHHVLFSFYALPPPGDASRVPPEHTNFYVDGHRVNASGSDSWPTEIHAQARIAKRVVDRLNAEFGGGFDPSTGMGGGIEIEFDVEDYRVAVEVPRGNLPVQVGDEIAHNASYSGLIDNLIFQGNWPKFFPAVSTTASPGRFDLWRPSLGRVTNSGSDDHHLRYTKRTQALEWDQPIRVLSYAWTAWKHNDVMGGALSLGLV